MSSSSRDEFCLILSLVHEFPVLVLSAYAILCLYDLDSDYLNPKDCARRLNGLVYPIVYCNVAVLVLLLVSDHWLLATVPAAPGTGFTNFQEFFLTRDLNTIHNRLRINS
jgi:hypothetical protein